MINNIFRPLILTALTFLLSFNLSCKTWNQKDWENLKDRNFTLYKVEVFSKGINKKISFSYMKKMQVFKILQIISNKYNIEIDSSFYEDFLASGDYESIKSSGILSNTTFVWENPSKVNNEVLIEYKVEEQEFSSGNTKSYKISLKSGNETRAYFIGGIAKIEEMLPSFAGKLGYVHAPGKGPNVYNYEDTGKELVLTDKKLKVIKKEKNLEMTKSELLIINMIENYIKLLPSNEKKAFKKKLIRYLQKK